jgi:hypothetical protein
VTGDTAYVFFLISPEAGMDVLRASIISDDVDLLDKAHFHSLLRRGPPYFYFSSGRFCFRDIVEWKVD